jgi:hypothetical protein
MPGPGVHCVMLVMDNQWESPLRMPNRHVHAD